jgi:hypothetical protein
MWGEFYPLVVTLNQVRPSAPRLLTVVSELGRGHILTAPEGDDLVGHILEGLEGKLLEPAALLGDANRGGHASSALYTPTEPARTGL